MAKSILFEALKRAIPQRHRKLIPSSAKRVASYVFWAEAETYSHAAILIAYLLPEAALHKLGLQKIRGKSSLYNRMRALSAFTHAKRMILVSDYTAAQSYLDRSIRNAPEVAEAYYLRGHIAVVLNESEAAIEDLTTAIQLGYDSADAHFYLGIAYSNLGSTTEAIASYERALALIPRWAQALVNLAHLKLWAGEEDRAVALLKEAIALEPAFSMAHQNVAALYDRSRFKPTTLDLECRREVMLYDAYNFAAERKFNAGAGHEGIELWGKALRLQKQMSGDFRLPEDLLNSVRATAGIDTGLPIRLLPYEWVTQIGHIAMLDTYCKIQALGWRPAANLLLLAPSHKVVNKAYLDYWRGHLHIVSDDGLVDQLFPYQRYIGDCFNAFLHEDGRVEAWPDVGAKAHIEWDRQSREPLLRLSDEDAVRGRETLQSLGMPKDAWFVCLHAREGGYHREIPGSTQEHRNTSIEDYFPAIRHVTDRGGWVVRLGDPSMTPLPPMPNVIDYAHSPAKCDWMDVYLCGSSRFFIGTTSGLTNAAISFGVPCLLVNCLSNFSQLWNNRVVFTLKLFWSEQEKRYLSLREIVDEPVRSRVFNLKSLANSGIKPINNSSEEILESVVEMFDRVEGKHNPATGSELMKCWNDLMGTNTMFGNAQPVVRYLARHREVIFAWP